MHRMELNYEQLFKKIAMYLCIPKAPRSFKVYFKTYCRTQNNIDQEL